MLDNIALARRGRRMADILKEIQNITATQKKLNKKALDLTAEHDRLKVEVKRLRRGEKL